jgi:hypothetical protein
MALRIADLRAAAARPRSVLKNLSEARSVGAKTAFLCHSHQDVDLARGFVTLLADSGWTVYVDWADPTMPEAPDGQTARRIQARIVELDYFIFLATARSMASRWCPWEIGYADGEKDIERILVVPTTDGVTTHGSEYLELYRRIDRAEVGGLGAWQPGDSSNGVLVKSL